MTPFANNFLSPVQSLSFVSAAPERNGPIWETGFFDRGDRPLGNDIAALRAGLGTHFHDPVRFLQNLRVVVHEDHGVSVRHQIMHHAGQPHDVRGCSPMDGSSSTYKTPVVRLRTARASPIR